MAGFIFDNAGTNSDISAETGSVSINGVVPGTLVSPVEISDPDPRLLIRDTNAAANTQLWDLINDAGTLSIRTRTDADGAGATAISLTRTTTTVNTIALTATTLDLNGLLDLDGTGSHNLNGTVSVDLVSGTATVSTIASGNEVDLTGTTIDINGNIDADGTTLDINGATSLTLTGTANAVLALTTSGFNMDGVLDLDGTGSHNLNGTTSVVLVSSSASISAIASGNEVDLTGTTIDANGNLDADGTTMDINGATSLTLTGTANAVVALTTSGFNIDGNIDADGTTYDFDAATTFAMHGGSADITLSGTEADITATLIDVNGLLALEASAVGSSTFRIPHGTAPSAPVNGDIWTTTTSIYAQVNGVTVDLAGGGGTPGGADTQLQYNNGGAFGGLADFTYDSGGSQYLVGTPNNNFVLRGAEATIADDSGATIELLSGLGNALGGGGNLLLVAGEGGVDGNGGDAQLVAGPGGATSGQAGMVSVLGGAGQGIGGGGDATVVGGPGGSTSGNGGSVVLAGGTVTSGTAGDVVIQVNGTENLRIVGDTGSWEFETDPGTLGYVLRSQGTSGAPYWDPQYLDTPTQTINLAPASVGYTVGTNLSKIYTFNVVGRDTALDDTYWSHIVVGASDNADTASLVGSPVETIGFTAGAATWTVVVSVTLGLIQVTMTGQAAKTIDWTVRAEEVGVG